MGCNSGWSFLLFFLCSDVGPVLSWSYRDIKNQTSKLLRAHKQGVVDRRVRNFAYIFARLKVEDVNQAIPERLARIYIKNKIFNYS